MTREETKELLPIMQAFANGKTIQFRTNNRPWGDLLDNDLNTNAIFEYRIKPEPKYRPFKNQEECWNEMLEHKPFSFVVNKDRLDYCGICRVFKDGKGISKVTFIGNPYCDVDMEIVFDRFNFADGTPFGIKEE